MSKIINSVTQEVVSSDFKLYVSGVVENYLNANGYDTYTYECLSDVIKTMTGDASTPFDTVGEMIQAMPDIVNCGEETCIFEVFGKNCDYWVLGWDYESDSELWTKILQKYFPDLIAVESED